MESEIDYSKHSEPELVDMFGRLDPRWAPAECARLAKYLNERGYIVTDGTTGPGAAVPGAAKLNELIGMSSPFECNVDFGNMYLGRTGVFASDLPAPYNFIGFVGCGTLVCDGINVWLSGHLADRHGLPSFFEENSQLACLEIANVELLEQVVRFECNVEDVAGDAICLWLADAVTASQLVGILPKRRTKDFHPRLARG